MMKILHTADWHIGQTFYDYDRKNEHIAFFDWLRNLIKTLEVNVLLIAGDIFDSPNPSADSQRLYYKFLHSVSQQNTDLQVIIIAGNHDSAARLEAPNPLLETMNIWVNGIIKRDINGQIDVKHLIVPLKQKENIEGWCLAIPYLRQGDYPESENYGQGVKRMYEMALQEIESLGIEEKAIIAMGHLQATGSEIMDGDRAERTTIGGLDCVSPDAFDSKIGYTALGHLHKAQQVSKRNNVRYAGSPLPMSFAEKHYKHGVTLVEIEGAKTTNIERILFEAPVKLLSIPDKPKPLNEVLLEIEMLEDGEKNEKSPYLEIKVLITEPEPSLRHQLEEKLRSKAVRLARMIATAPSRTNEPKPITFDEFKAINPLEMAKIVFKKNYNKEMPQEMERLLTNVIEEVTR